MHQDWSQRLGGNTFTAEQIEQARAGETFAVLESELSKLVSLQGETVDWALVQTAAQSYLENEGSDLLVATWLVLAAFVQQNAVGLQQSLGVLVRLHQECWETMTPPLRRMRARRNQMQWLQQLLSPRGIEASKPVPSVKTEFVVDDALSLDMSMVALLAGAQAQAQVAAQNLLALEQQLGQNLDRFLNK